MSARCRSCFNGERHLLFEEIQKLWSSSKKSQMDGSEKRSVTTSGLYKRVTVVGVDVLFATLGRPASSEFPRHHRCWLENGLVSNTLRDLRFHRSANQSAAM